MYCNVLVRACKFLTKFTFHTVLYNPVMPEFSCPPQQFPETLLTQYDFMITITDVHSITLQTHEKLIPVLKRHKSSHFASVVNDTEVSIIFELLGFLKFCAVAQFLDYFLHKGFVCGFGKPALLIQ